MLEKFKEAIFSFYGISGEIEVNNIIAIIFDWIIVLAVLAFIVVVFRKRIKVYKMIFIYLIYMILLICSILFYLEHLRVLLYGFVVLVIVYIIVIYNNEIKKTLSKRYGRNTMNENKFTSDEQKEVFIKEFVEVILNMSKKKVGAIICIEGDKSLRAYIEKAIQVDALFSPALIQTIFYPGTPCHDGAVIIRKNRVISASTFLPSTNNYEIPQNLGTRHRAAIGISEVSDCFTVVVSEETGNVSFTLNGYINIGINEETLKNELVTFLK